MRETTHPDAGLRRRRREDRKKFGRDCWLLQWTQLQWTAGSRCYVVDGCRLSLRETWSRCVYRGLGARTTQGLLCSTSLDARDPRTAADPPGSHMEAESSRRASPWISCVKSSRHWSRWLCAYRLLKVCQQSLSVASLFATLVQVTGTSWSSWSGMESSLRELVGWKTAIKFDGFFLRWIRIQSGVYL